jgi:hypothetical protein
VDADIDPSIGDAEANVVTGLAVYSCDWLREVGIAVMVGLLVVWSGSGALVPVGMGRGFVVSRMMDAGGAPVVVVERAGERGAAAAAGSIVVVEGASAGREVYLSTLGYRLVLLGLVGGKIKVETHIIRSSIRV